MKRFNYTGRKKILREDVHIRLLTELEEVPVVSVDLDLNDYDFEDNYRIYLEPQRKTRFMRIHLGEVREKGSHEEISLSGFDDADGLNFRVKVVDEANGQLHGIAENLKPYDRDGQPDPDQESILPVKSEDLSSRGVLWRVDYMGQQAILQVEKELGNKEQVVRSLLFKGFILPSAMHQILTKVVSDDWDVELSDPSELSTAWIIFARGLGAGLPNSEGDNDEWVDDAVRILCSRIKVRSEIIADFEQGVWK